MPWWGWLISALALVVVLGIVAARRAAHAERKRTISWWAGRNGFRYTKGSPELLGYLRGAPFDRGSSRDVQDLLSGQVAGRPALITQFSWYHLPSGEQSDATGTSGLRSGICSAALLELPAPVPELLVRKEITVDRALGRDLQLESEQFNAAFRINGTVDRFSYDVLHPRTMQWLLSDPRARRYSFRFDGPMLVVWQEEQVKGATELGELTDFLATLYGMVPQFVFGMGYQPQVGQTTVPISAIPPAAFGSTPVGALAFLQRLTHRGHTIERYEHVRELWGATSTAVSVKINVPTVWPVLMIAPKVLATSASPPRKPRFDDGVRSDDKAFDKVFACGTPRPDFALRVLRPELTGWLRSQPLEQLGATVVFQSEQLTPEHDGVPEPTRRGGVWVSAVGELANQPLADQLTELVCDIVERLPGEVLSYHLDAPRPPEPPGGYPNQLPGYFVLPSHRV